MEKTVEEETPALNPQEIRVEEKHVIAAYQFRCAQMANELAIKDAVISQLQEEINGLRQVVDTLGAQPQHNGRMTRAPRPNRKPSAGKKGG